MISAIGLFVVVDETRDTLDTVSANKTVDGGLGDSTLDVVTQDLVMRLDAFRADALAPFSTSRHDDGFEKVVEKKMRAKMVFTPDPSFTAEEWRLDVKQVWLAS